MEEYFGLVIIYIKKDIKKDIYKLILFGSKETLRRSLKCLVNGLIKLLQIFNVILIFVLILSRLILTCLSLTVNDRVEKKQDGVGSIPSNVETLFFGHIYHSWLGSCKRSSKFV